MNKRKTERSHLLILLAASNSPRDRVRGEVVRFRDGGVALRVIEKKEIVIASVLKEKSSVRDRKTNKQTNKMFFLSIGLSISMMKMCTLFFYFFRL